MSAECPAGSQHTGPGASVRVAREQPPEQFVYVASLYNGTGIDRPDFIARWEREPNGMQLDLERRAKVQTIDLGDEGMIPLEIRWQHDPDSAQGFVGATLSSNIMCFYRDNGSWSTEKAIDVANEELDGWPLEGGVPGLITDLVLSLDDKDLFLSNWLHGDLRHDDVSDPRQPRLRSQVWLGGLLGRDGGRPHEIHLPGGDCTTEILQ